MLRFIRRHHPSFEEAVNRYHEIVDTVPNREVAAAIEGRIPIKEFERYMRGLEIRKAYKDFARFLPTEKRRRFREERRELLRRSSCLQYA